MIDGIAVMGPKQELTGYQDMGMKVLFKRFLPLRFASLIDYWGSLAYLDLSRNYWKCTLKAPQDFFFQ